MGVPETILLGIGLSFDITLDNKNTSMINPTKINIDTQKNIVELYVAEN